MINKLQRVFRFPHFLYLLPLFFVFHGFVQNPAPVTFSDFISLVAEYLLAGAVLLMIGWLLFKKWYKASLLSFSLLFLHLFFGAFHDALKSMSPVFFLARYSVLLPVLFITILFFLVYLKKTHRRFTRLFLYLNLLFLLLLLLDIPVLFQLKDKSPSTISLQPCEACEKPDIYLIIADEYADSTSLANVFGFNNGAFQSALRQRGFYIATSVSNYNFTPFSVASLFTMDYLTGLEGRNSSYADRLTCAGLINQNVVWDFFEKAGYQLQNNSIYKINNQPTVAPQAHFRIGTDFIASHTLLSRLKKDLGYHLATTLKLKRVIDAYFFEMDKTNKKLLNRFTDDVKKKSAKSRFSYTHIHLPHYPYYYKQDGTYNRKAATEGNAFDKEDYLAYLQYSNGIYLRMIDEILSHSAKPPVIFFMSDHGFREFAEPTPDEKKAYFMNMNAIYLPSGDYSRFYDGISGVNHFRAFFNTAFGQNLPMLKDSTSFLQE